MRVLAEEVARARGWTRRLIALLAGGLGALALAPLDWGPSLVLTMTVSVWLIDGTAQAPEFSGAPGWAGLRSAFGAGWWLGFGYHLAGFWWLGSAFLIDPDFTWALPLGVVGVPALLSIFTGVGFVLARAVWSRSAIRLFALAFGLGVSEWARGHLFTGFPWNPFGMGLGGRLLTAQPAALVGLDGLTFLTIALFAAPAILWDRMADRRRWWALGMAVVGVLAIVGFGLARLTRDRPATVPHIVVRIMQPGLRPDVNFAPENKDAIVSHYINLSERNDAAKGVKLSDVTMLVWPESAFPFILTRDPQELGRIGAALPSRTSLVTGAAREVDYPATAESPSHSDYFNAVEVIARGGTLIGSYDKIHLVPFGEYLPFNALLSRLGLRNFVPVPGGFVPGSDRRLLDVPGMPPASPLICYEAIFPDEAVKGSPERRPSYLLNITNDGWFGVTSGPSQHFAQARLRTIEQGLPMVRGAATGISAMLDPYGRVLASLPLGSEGILDSPLPQPLAPTFFSRFGDWPFWIACIIAASTCLVVALRRRTTATLLCSDH